jgi:putative membrane protein
LKYTITKYQIALFVALLFHASGAIGILFTPYKDWFVQNTTFNLLLMAGLLIWTQSERNAAFFYFALIAFATGMITEIIGVNTGLLFGDYAYGSIMGVKLMSVPLLIGVQWFVTVFASGVIISKIKNALLAKTPEGGQLMRKSLQTATIVIDGALLATFFDFVMEPVAVKLGFWQWNNHVIPLYNYFCWFVISALLLLAFNAFRFNKANHFAVHLFIIQLLFFLSLRILL